ncbi:MAG: CooT family nickel-binding protein [Anaerolineae bacterium]|nr:CooT family nickel-binding protein [Anaerolineae bacterium]
MCEARAYIIKNGDEQQIMQDVVLAQSEGETCLLVNLLGEQKLVRGHIAKIDFIRHAIYLTQTDTV